MKRLASRVMPVIPIALTLALAQTAVAQSDATDPSTETLLAAANTYTVVVKTTVRYPFTGDDKGRSHGAGFVVDRARGWVLTNAHVASSSVAKLTVSFSGADPVVAQRLYVDPFLDLAVLAIPPESLPASATQAPLDCQSAPRAGAAVVAYGHPGQYLFSGTKGIISGVSDRTRGEMLQTDVAMNPGNSGGPLINLSTGKVAGVNTSRAAGMQNTNFAISARYACPIVDLLRAGKDPSPPKGDWRFFTEKDGGSKLTIAHPGETGARLGLRAGDEIVSVEGGEPVGSETQLIHALRGHLDDIRLTVRRQGAVLQLHGRAEPEPRELDKSGLFIDGMLVSELDRRVRRDIDFKGVMVDYVDAGSAAETAEIEQGQILVSVNGQPTPDLAAARRAIEAAQGSSQPATLVFKVVSLRRGAMSTGLFEWVQRKLAVTGVTPLRAGESRL